MIKVITYTCFNKEINVVGGKFAVSFMKNYRGTSVQKFGFSHEKLTFVQEIIQKKNYTKTFAVLLTFSSSSSSNIGLGLCVCVYVLALIIIIK